MRLRVLAPTVSRLALAPGNGDAATRFWQDVGPALDELPGNEHRRLTLHHATSPGRYNRYRKIEEHSLPRPLEVLEIEVVPTALRRPDGVDGERSALSTVEAVDLWSGLVAVRCLVYDNGIALVEAEVEFAVPSSSGAPGGRSVAQELQTAAVELGEQVALACHRQHLDPVVSAALDADDDGAAVAVAVQTQNLEPGRVLWVTRSLLVPGIDLAHRPLVRDWLHHLPDADDDVAALLAGDVDHLARWLNYVYVEPEQVDLAATGRQALLWMAMCHAQYHYAALELVGDHLESILTRSLRADSDRLLSSLREDLEGATLSARMVAMRRRDVLRHLPRTVAGELEEILSYWDYDGVLLAPIESKVATCEARLKQMESRRSARASLYTDLILLGLTVTSITGTTVALADFGRSGAADPAQSAFNLGRDDLVSLFAAQSSDAIVLVSLAASIVLALVYWSYRRLHKD